MDVKALIFSPFGSKRDDGGRQSHTFGMTGSPPHWQGWSPLSFLSSERLDPMAEA